MKHNFKPNRIALLWILCLGQWAMASVSVTDLRCEYRQNPLDIDAAQPRLSWKLTSDQRGEHESAYQIRVASSANLLGTETPDLWDTGKVDASDSIQIPYNGKPLSSAEQCFWKVRIWNANGQPSPWSEGANWQMGLLNPDDWKGKWITAPPPVAGKTSLPMFRRSVAVSKPVTQAIVRVCGLGQFELQINGQKVGDSVLDPGWTNYRKTCLYVTFDVTDKLKPGDNGLTVLLGNGMFNVVAGRYTKFKGSFGLPKLIAQLQIEYADGSTDCIATDKSWTVADGPITFSSIYGGEDYDARLEEPASFSAAVETDSPGGRLMASSAPPVRIERVLDPIAITQPSPGVFVYDLGQNCSLMPKLIVQGPAGSKVKITPGELLTSAGVITQKSSGKGPTFFTYILKGQGNESWSPRFCYYGNRYLQVEGARPASIPTTRPADDALPVVEKLQGQFITSSAPATGTFSCSNDLFNHTDALIRWAIRSNMVSILTDCPHREKLGWLEEDHLMGASLMYNFQMSGLFTKIAGDMNDAQLDTGLVPDIAPEYTKFAGDFRDSPEWGSAAVLVPWQVYQWYGDLSVLRNRYDMMKRYVAYLGSRSKDGVVDYGLGDWYDIGKKAPGKSQLTPPSLTATAFYYRDITILEQTARLLSHDDDVDTYQHLGETIHDDFNRKFYDAKAHTYATGSQTANALPLVFGLAPSADAPKIVDDIVQDVRNHSNGLTSGDVGYRYLLRALAEGGRSDVIFDMNSRSDRPGYGYMLAHGATSLTEAWDARGSSSQNHFMLGHIMEWFYADLAGIQRDPDVPAFKKIIIKPAICGDLTWAKATYESPYGTIASGWKRDNGKFTLDVTIPPNTTATVYLPTSDPNSLTESGTPASVAPGVKPLKSDGNLAAFGIDSGHYIFVAEGRAELQRN
jgi:alpha-L-rhamnosidase